MAELLQHAKNLAHNLMSKELPRRWAHVQAVGIKAEHLGFILGKDVELLAAAAWLHDIGYAEPIRITGFHPLDGATYLRVRGEEHRLCCLVANHSGAFYEATLRGLANEQRSFPDERSTVRDALWYCDMTTSPSGEIVDFSERLEEIRCRYGHDHFVSRAITLARDDIESAIAKVEDRILHAGVGLG